MARFYSDENFRYEVVRHLRLTGHDIVTVQEAGKSGSTDSQVLADATAAGRVVLTFNRWHFERLHRQNQNHSGIFSCTPDPDTNALASRIDQAIVATASFAGKHIRINRPPWSGVGIIAAAC